MNDSRLQAPMPMSGALGRYARDPDWQRIWLATQETSWQSLAILPAEPELSTWPVAQALLEVGWQHRGKPKQHPGKPIVVADLRAVSLDLVVGLIEEVQRRVQEGEIVLIALSCVDESPAAAHVARAADRTILCVRLGSSPMRIAQATVQMVGKERFLGTVALRPSHGPGDVTPNRKLLTQGR